MQRYMAGDLPQGTPQRPQNPPRDRAQTPLHHAVQLGGYVLEQRGREGAAAYAAGLAQVLPGEMIEGLCGQLGIPAPQRRQEPAAQQQNPPPPPQPPKRSEPDMETILRLMQMVKGNGGQPDLQSLMKLMGK